MQVQVAAEVVVGEPGAAQQRGRLEGPGRRHDGAGAHFDRVAGGGARQHAARDAVAHEHALGPRVDEDAGAVGLGVGQPRLDRRALGPLAAAVAARAARARVAALDVARHRLGVPAQRVEPAQEDAVAPARIAVARVDAEALPDGGQAVLVLVARERRDAHGCPLRAHVVRRPERGRVVDGRAAAEAGAGQQPDALIGGRHAAAGRVQPPVALELAAVEVLVVVVAAGLEDDDVQPGGRQHGRGGAAARARADHAHVAVEHGVAVDGKRLQSACAAARQPAQRPAVAHGLPGGIRTAARPGDEVVHDEHRAPQRLERGTAEREPAVAPRQQRALALTGGQRRESPRPPGQGGGAERRERQRERAAIRRPRRPRHGLEDRFGDAELGRRRQTVAAGRERVADRVERPPPARAQREGRGGGSRFEWGVNGHAAGLGIAQGSAIAT